MLSVQQLQIPVAADVATCNIHSIQGHLKSFNQRTSMMSVEIPGVLVLDNLLKTTHLREIYFATFHFPLEKIKTNPAWNKL